MNKEDDTKAKLRLQMRELFEIMCKEHNLKQLTAGKTAHLTITLFGPREIWFEDETEGYDPLSARKPKQI